MKLIKLFFLLMLIPSLNAVVNEQSYKKWHNDFKKGIAADDPDKAVAAFILLEGAFNFDKSSVANLSKAAQALGIALLDQQFIDGLLRQLEQMDEQTEAQEALSVLDDLISKLPGMYEQRMRTKTLKDALENYLYISDYTGSMIAQFIKSYRDLMHTSKDIQDKVERIKKMREDELKKIDTMFGEYIKKLTDKEHSKYIEAMDEVRKQYDEHIEKSEFFFALTALKNELVYAFLSAILWIPSSHSIFFPFTSLADGARTISDNDSVDNQTRIRAKVLSADSQELGAIVLKHWKKLGGKDYTQTNEYKSGQKGGLFITPEAS